MISKKFCEARVNFRGILVGIYAFFSLLVVVLCMILFKNKIRTIRKLWANSMLKIIGVKFTIIGKANPDANMLMLNHNSMLDILIFDYLWEKEIAWVTKKSLSKVPVFGQIFKRPKLILINNKSKSALKRLLKESKKRLHDNMTLAVFPEGTRGKDDSILPFQIGAQIVAQKFETIIQPIIIINSKQRLDTKTFSSSKGEIKIIYLETPDIKKENWYKDLENEMREVYKQYV